MSYIGNSPKVNRLRLQPRATDPVSPAEGDLQYADGSAREEGLWVYKNSAWVKVGSEQSGQINYISNGDAETGNTSGWSLGNVSLTSAFPSGVPTFGSGANANLSFTNTTVTPIAGTRSLLYASSAATTAGNFVASDAFTVDPADRGRVLQIAFNYQLVSGTANFSGTSSNSFGIAIYDVTASQWIMPAGVWNLVQSSGVGRATATFQTGVAAGQSYRLVLFNANATSGAVSLELDRISVGPQIQVQGPAVSDWTSFTPVVSNTTNAVSTARWRRIGDSAEVRVDSRFSGATNNTAYTVQLPSGMSIDTNKTLASFSGLENFGTAAAHDSGGNHIGTVTPVTGDLTRVTVYGDDGATQWNFATATPFVAGGGDYVEVSFIVPIAGWSSNSVMSQDTDTRVVAAKLVGTTGAAYGTSGIVKVPYNTISFDTHSIVSTANSTITIPVSGYYKISGSILVGASGATINGNSEQYLDVYVDGAANARLGNYVNPTNGAQNGLNAAPQPRIGGSVELYLNAGQVVDLRFSGAFGATANFSNSSTRDFFSVERLSGPAVVAASETVSMSYTATAFPAGLPNNVATTLSSTYVTWSRVVDTHNSFNTTSGIYTAPVSGIYRVYSSFTFNPNASNVRQLIAVGGSSSQNGPITTATGTSVGAHVSAIFRCNAGDAILIQAFQNAGGTLAGTNQANFTIERIGN